MPNFREFDYTLMFWFRSQMSYAELLTDDRIDNQAAYIFELPGSGSCYMFRDDEGVWLQCTPASAQFKINLSEFADLQAWMHLTYSADLSASTSTLTIDGKSWQSSYTPMRDYRAYYGSGMDMLDGNGHK